MPEQPALAMLPQLERDLGSFGTGILPRQRLAGLLRDGVIFADDPIAERQLQPASLDLRLGDIASEVEASFLPIGSRVEEQLAPLTVARLDLGAPTVLRRGRVYIIPLMERLRLPSDISGKANPKSTTGRLDVFTRLIVDGADEFERVPSGYKGPLYVEVSPRSFDLIVRKGDALNQVRLIRGSPSPPGDRALKGLESDEPLVYNDDGTPEKADIDRGVWVGVDLRDQGGVVGYRALVDAPAVDVSLVNHYDPRRYWEPIEAPARGELIMHAGRFYILASRQRITVPGTHAAEMINYDPSIGEFRVHYAGFFDPGFGVPTARGKGARAVLEVRPHEVPFLLRHDQSVGCLVYERLLETPDKIYGGDLGSSYQQQGLRLSKQFRMSA